MGRSPDGATSRPWSGPEPTVRTSSLPEPTQGSRGPGGEPCARSRDVADVSGSERRAPDLSSPGRRAAGLRARQMSLHGTLGEATRRLDPVWGLAHAQMGAVRYGHRPSRPPSAAGQRHLAGSQPRHVRPPRRGADRPPDLPGSTRGTRCPDGRHQRDGLDRSATRSPRPKTGRSRPAGWPRGAWYTSRPVARFAAISERPPAVSAAIDDQGTAA